MLRVIVDHTGPATGLNVLHFAGDLSVAGLAQDVADATSVFLTTVATASANAQQLQVRPEVLELEETTGALTGVTSVTTEPIQGSGGTAQVGQALSALVRWRTNTVVGGRFLQGRSYIPGFAVGNSTANGEVSPATIAILNDAAAIFHGSSPLGVWSPTSGQIVEVLSATTWNEYAVQRRRRD